MNDHLYLCKSLRDSLLPRLNLVALVKANGWLTMSGQLVNE